MGIYILLCLWMVVGLKAINSTNIALGKPATQSSVGKGKTAELAVDGNRNANFRGGSCIHSQHGVLDQWWIVDLLGVYDVTDVWILNRGDMDAYKFHDFVVEVYDKNPVACGEMTKSICNSHPGKAGLRENVHMPCQDENKGRFVKVLKLPEFITDPASDIFIICEVEVQGIAVNRTEIDYMYSKYEGKLVSTNSEMTVGVTGNGCSMMCTYDIGCYGFNHRPSDGGCQLVKEFLPSRDLAVEPEWNYYSAC